MAKREAPLSALEKYLPPNTFEEVSGYLQQYHVHLTVARERRSILGDYRNRYGSDNHRISVNGNLNPYSFLITLIHELAHLLTYEQYGNRVLSHGKEWKGIFGKLLFNFIQKKVFPQDIEQALMNSIQNPAASSCADVTLMRTLMQYDAKRDGLFVEALSEGALFKTPDGKVFQKGKKLRKRYQCVEVGTGKLYLFSPIYEVKII